MIRDYPDTVPGSGSGAPASPSSSVSPASSIFMSPPPSPLPGATHLPPPTRIGPIPPPPRHPSALGPQTTYTPYIPRSKRTGATQHPNPLSATGQPVPIITSNSHGGVTTRHPAPGPAKTEGVSANGVPGRLDDGPSAALLDKVRALDTLPRLGALRTLDLRGNDLRVSRTVARARVADRLLIWVLAVWRDVPRASVEAEPDVEGAQSEREQARRAVSHGDRRSSRAFSFGPSILTLARAQLRG